MISATTRKQLKIEFTEIWQIFGCLSVFSAERLAEGRGSETVATAENNQVPATSPMRQKPRYLQRLVRPALVVRCLGFGLVRLHEMILEVLLSFKSVMMNSRCACEKRRRK